MMMMSPRRWIVVVCSSAVILATNNAIASTAAAAELTGEIGSRSRRRHAGFDAWLLAHKNNNNKEETTAEDYNYNNNYNYQERLDIWLNNAATVDAHNRAYDAGYTSFKMSVEKSPFADLTDEEFVRDFLMEPQQKCSATTHRSSGRLRPQHSSGGGDTAATAATTAGSCHYQVDWRTKGIITPIKNQRSCGSCWTFSTTGCLEAHLCKAAAKDCTHWSGLAEQQLVDCAGDYNNDGCNGGLPSQAFEYIKYNGGIDLETSYPYVGTDGTCHAKGTGTVGGKVAEVFNITSKDEEDLVYAVAHVGPVSVAYQVSANFRFYSHGVYDSYDAATNTTQCKSESYDVNHAVVAVGLDSTSDGVPFYIVRNSWGTSWGMEGYFWMKRGQNLCGVSDCASFPLVPSSLNNNAANTVDGDSGTTATTTSTAAMLRASSRTK